MQLPDSNFYNRVWTRARLNSSLYRWQKDPAAWQPFWELFAPTYLKICRALMPANRQMVAEWQKDGLVPRSGCVLDIGCGPGTYTLPLAEAAGEVVAVDTSAQMLCVLDEEARRLGLENIRTLQADWSELAVEREYDLVFAANSPAIHNLETLLKMNAASRGGCILICYAGGMSPSLRSLLWERVMGEKMQGNSFDIAYPFNILYREGFFPHLSFREQQYNYTEKAAVVLENYRAYFKIFGCSGPSVDRILEQAVREKSVNGTVAEQVAYKLAVMYWDAVPARGREPVACRLPGR